jgi:hypothetical protein
MVRRGLNCNDVKAADRRLARAGFLLLLSLMAPSESDGQLTVRVRLIPARACHWEWPQLARVHAGTVAGRRGTLPAPSYAVSLLASGGSD